MTLDIAMLYADIASTAAVALMLYIARTMIQQDKRIQKIESDLYVENSNPTSLPLTKQVYNLQQDVATIKDTCEKLHTTIESINSTIHDCLLLPKKTRVKNR